MNALHRITGFAILLILSPFTALGQRADGGMKPTILKVDDFNGPTDRDRIHFALEAATKQMGPVVVRFSKREYLISPTNADTYVPVLGVAGLQNATLEGSGAILVATNMLDVRKGYFFKLSGFSNVTVRDLTLTFRPLTYVQGKVTELKPRDKRVVVALDPRWGGIENITKSKNDYIYSRVGLKEDPRLPKAESPSWLAVGCNPEGSIKYTRLSENTYEVDAGNYYNLSKVLGGAYTWTVGDPVVIWKRGTQDGFTFEEGTGLVLEGLRVEACLHFSIKLRAVRGAVMTSCAVEPVPGGMLSGSADGIDVQQSTDVRVENCRITANGDDGISFLNFGHGWNGQSFETNYPPPYPNKNADVTLSGNRLLGCNRNGILLLASPAQVISNDVRHIRQYGLKLSGDGDTLVRGNVFATCGTFTAWAHILDELDTGILCMAPWKQKNLTIEGNLFDDWYHMPAILGTAMQDGVIRNNVFRLADGARFAAKPHNPWMDRGATIAFTPAPFMKKTNVCRNVLVIGNTFEVAGHRDPALAFATNGAHSNLVFQDNRTAP